MSSLQQPTEEDYQRINRRFTFIHVSTFTGRVNIDYTPELCGLQRPVLAQPVVNVTKSGNKLGLHIPNLSVTNEASRVIRVTIQSDSGKSSFLAKASEWVCIPTRIRLSLGIRERQAVQVLDLRIIEPHTPQPIAIVGDEIDMLSLIPAKTHRGYRLYVDSYEDEEPRLRIWYYHERGAARQIELKRYVNMRILGGLLGQLQAEGEKNDVIVSFKNASIAEHDDFISGLRELGLSSSAIGARCVFNPGKANLARVREFSETYYSSCGLQISKFDEVAAMKGTIAADTYVRSTVLAAMLRASIRTVLKGVVDVPSIREAFVAKLLSGDGTLDSRKTSRRLDVRVTIVDNNADSLIDYTRLLAKEGFKAKLHIEKINVRTYCTWLNLLKLYQIGAFRNNRNWIKLLCSLQIAIKGRENKSYARLLDLSRLNCFTSQDVCARYPIGKRAANLWMVRMLRLNLIRRKETNKRHYVSYVLTEEGASMVGVLKSADGEFLQLCYANGSRDAEAILEQSKTKKRKLKSEIALNERSTEECPEAR